MTRALVTGGTGFVGSNLIEALNARGIEVVAMQEANAPEEAIEGLHYTPVIGDLLNLESLRRAVEDVDWVFHVAGVSDYMHTPTANIYEVNVEGTRNMLAAAREAGVSRFVYTSSAAALGVPLNGKLLLDETDSFAIAPRRFPYGHSKHLAEAVVREAASDGFRALSVLPSVVVGPRDQGIICGNLVIQLVKGAVPGVPPGGMGYIDARDLAEAHIAAAERGRPGERYILNGHNLSHRETFDIAAAALSLSPPRRNLPGWLLGPIGAFGGVLNALGADLPFNGQRAWLSDKYIYYNNSKAVRELGLTARPFAESICATYEWYRVHGYLERAGIKNAPPIEVRQC
jgi:dihydroflavonol-4-reductase